MAAKFRIGDHVKLNHRELAILTGKAKRHSYRNVLYTPNANDLQLIGRRRARRIVRIVYHPELQANVYYLGSNHRGKADKLSLIGFRSYQLELITNPSQQGRPRQKRRYTKWQ